MSLSSIKWWPAALILLFYPATAWPLTVDKDTAWSGTVDVEGQVTVEKSATLTIAPGTVVRFARGGADAEGLADTGLLVKGAVVADGRPGARIIFTSAVKSPAPGDWGEVKVFKSTGSSFTDCDFSFGGWGLHVHESDLKVTGCTFTNNSFGGLRGKAGHVEVEGSTFKGMDIGIRYWRGSPHIHKNTFTENTTGIFLRQDCDGARVNFNNIYGNLEYDVKLGDGQKRDVDFRNNWWGTSSVSSGN